MRSFLLLCVQELIKMGVKHVTSPSTDAKGAPAMQEVLRQTQLQQVCLPACACLHQ